jgi:hypothetical protein
MEHVLLLNLDHGSAVRWWLMPLSVAVASKPSKKDIHASEEDIIGQIIQL